MTVDLPVDHPQPAFRTCKIRRSRMMIRNSSPTTLGLSYVPILFIASILTYLLLFLVFRFVRQTLRTISIPPVLKLGIDQAERGKLAEQETLTANELFQLERRAFLSKTWLYVCHRSRFSKQGDYITFELAGIAFFLVQGKDDKLRAFHNVCRHRAYTVVRKPCGTSTRFACRYHGWQYDDTGSLVKAPKFEEMPDFNLAENGLFEIKLVQTVEGLVFINFDAGTMHLPFSEIHAGLDLNRYQWIDGLDVVANANWKLLAGDFLDRVHWDRLPFNLFSKRQSTRTAFLLGPLSVTRKLEEGLWSTMTLLPVSPSETNVRIDFYRTVSSEMAPKTVEKWKWMLEQEVLGRSVPGRTKTETHASFSYECGGRIIDLTAILAQHQRTEAVAKRKVEPAIRVTGLDDVDQEASALCDAVDEAARATEQNGGPACSRVRSFSRRLEW